jgi:hypothetical protein
MAITWAQGTFTAATGTGNQTTDTGSGVTGKILILFGSTQTAAGTAAGMYGFFGIATSASSEACISWAGDDNLATTDYARGASFTACVNILSDATTPTVDALADFVDFTTGGAGRFTINWSNAAASAWIIHYIYIGGTDITNAIVLQKTMATGLGNASYTGAGFKGDFALFFGTDQTAVGNATANFGMHFGAAIASTEQFSHSAAFSDASTHTNHVEHYQSTSKCIAFEISLAINAVADFVSWDSDGFTLNWTDAASSAWQFYILVVKGGSWSLNSFLSPSGTGSQSVTTDFTPKGVFFLSAGNTTAVDTEGVEANPNFGAMGESPIAEDALAFSCDDTINSEDNQSTATTKCIRVIKGAAGATVLEADATSLDASGYTINWSTTAVNYRFFGIAVGNTLLIAGVTKDNAGAALASCDTYLFREDAFGTLVLISSQVSDGSGNYSYQVNDNIAKHFVIAFKGGSPNRMDVTDRVLAGV